MRNRYVFLADTFAVVLAAVGAFVLRLDWFFQRQPEYTSAFTFCVIAALVIKPPIFMVFGLYRRYWRYATVSDLLVVLVAVSAASVGLAVGVTVGLFLSAIPFFPRSILAIDWLLTAACISGVRMSIRIIGEQYSRPAEHDGESAIKRILVAGAGDAGALVVREMQRNPQLGMTPICFLDDQPAKAGKKIYDVPVVGSLAQLERVVQSHTIDEVVIAMPKAPGTTVRAVLEACQRANVPSRAVPGLFEILEGGLSISRLRRIEITDLLRRAQIEARPDTGAYLRGQVVLITGGGGSIGSELCRQVARADAAALVVLGHGENSIFDSANQLRAAFPRVRIHTVIADVRDQARVRATFARYRPTIVFHAAAHKHVPLMEDHPEEAITNNVIGTRTVVDAAIVAGVERFVMISTDKAVAPTSIMGASKRVAEMIVRQAAKTHKRAFLAVRFGNVLGSRGSVVPYFKAQIEHGGPITITHPDMRRFFMTIPEAVYLVLKAGGLSDDGELFVLNMGEPVRIVDLAQDLVRLSGLSPDDIPIVFTGLRPGEKLEERLWEPDSIIEPHGDRDVFRVREADATLDPAVTQRVLRELERAALAGDGLAIHKSLSELIPTFVSSWHDTPSSQSIR
jgi:FlaA1/EpsC-like NDP-sugar epimerase